MKAQQFRVLAVLSRRPEFKSQYPSNKSRNPQLFISPALNDLMLLWSLCAQTWYLLMDGFVWVYVCRVCVSVCAQCVCVSMHLCVCAYICRQEKDIGHLLYSLLFYCLETVLSSNRKPEARHFWLGWLAIKLPWEPLYLPYHIGSTGIYGYAQLLLEY